MKRPISVVVATRNRAHKLGQFLERLDLDELAEVDAELIVVDNGSRDATQTLLQQFAQRAPDRVVIEREPLRGLSRARNCGVRRSSGQLIALLDDDAYPEPGYFREVKRLGETTKYDFFGGRALRATPDAANTSINEGTTLREFDRRSVFVAGSIHGCSMVLRRRVFEKVGLFDTALGVGSKIPSAEDYQILVRALAAGMNGAFVPSLAVIHDHGRRKGSAESARVKAWYDYGRGAVLVDRIVHGDLRYLEYWARAVRNGHPLPVLRRELAGGVRYLLRLRRRRERFETADGV